jgi:hypothetical protein
LPKVKNGVVKELQKLMAAEMIYPILDSPWVSLSTWCQRKDEYQS